MEESKKFLLTHSKLISLVRLFFEQLKFNEIITPSLVINPGLEPSLEYFSTKLKTSDMGSIHEQTKFLVTSPEYALKKALGFGLSNIYEVKNVYRNGEQGNFHRYEFLMLEWYRSPGKYTQIADDFYRLINFLNEGVNFSQEKIQKKEFTLTELFDLNNINLNQCMVGKYVTLPQEYKVLLEKDEFSFEDVFYIITDDLIKSFDSKRIYFLFDYPDFGGGLAKSKNNGFVERFEVYWKGIELGNAFGEINNSMDQKNRCQNDLDKRAKYKKSLPKHDLELYESLDKIKDDFSGIAVGLDRLFSAIMSKSNIEHPLFDK